MNKNAIYYFETITAFAVGFLFVDWLIWLGNGVFQKKKNLLMIYIITTPGTNLPINAVIKKKDEKRMQKIPGWVSLKL